MITWETRIRSDVNIINVIRLLYYVLTINLYKTDYDFQIKILIKNIFLKKPVFHIKIHLIITGSWGGGDLIPLPVDMSL